jgi:hypothetical protein
MEKVEFLKLFSMLVHLFEEVSALDGQPIMVIVAGRIDRFFIHRNSLTYWTLV